MELFSKAKDFREFHKYDLAPIAFSFGTRSQKQQKTFLKNLHFLEGLFRFTVNISGVSHYSVAFGKAALLNSYAGWGATLQPRPTFETKSRQKPL